MKTLTQQAEKAVALARENYANCSDDDLEIDDNPDVLDAEDGFWVAAWVWVDKGDLE